MPNLVGQPAPLLDVQFDALLADGTIGKICLKDFVDQGKYIVLFCHPLNHTFVCPTEINAFSDLAPEFAKNNCVVIGASVDSVYSHFAWRETPRKKGGLGAETQIPIIAVRFLSYSLFLYPTTSTSFIPLLVISLLFMYMYYYPLTGPHPRARCRLRLPPPRRSPHPRHHHHLRQGYRPLLLLSGPPCWPQPRGDPPSCPGLPVLRCER